MFAAKLQSALIERPSALIRRLLTEQAMVHWPRYVLAFVLMAIAAAATALIAYLIGDAINAAYIDRNMSGIIVLGVRGGGMFVVRALATYGQQVMLAADRQPHHRATTSGACSRR